MLNVTDVLHKGRLMLDRLIDTLVPWATADIRPVTVMLLCCAVVPVFVQTGEPVAVDVQTMFDVAGNSKPTGIDRTI